MKPLVRGRGDRGGEAGNAHTACHAPLTRAASVTLMGDGAL